VDKTFVPQPSPEPKVKVFIPMYKPLKTERCEKCGKVIAEPKELIRIMRGRKAVQEHKKNFIEKSSTINKHATPNKEAFTCFGGI
jgi:hypothetical protein